MNRIVSKVMKIRKTNVAQKSASAEKDDKKDKTSPSKITDKGRKKAHSKKLKRTVEEFSTSSTKTQLSIMDESTVAKEMEKLKTDLMKGSKRDQANKWIDSLLDKGIAGLEMELEKLNKIVEKVGRKGFDANMERNFNKTIVCQDKDRVLLKNTANNYIHANYINTPKFMKHFICTQQPLPTTVELFYKMILQEEVQCVVMLCSFTENTGKNCPQYFPQSFKEHAMKFGSIKIKCISVEKMREEEEITITTLAITDGHKAQQIIKHYHWKNWPERGFPNPTLALFNLLCGIRNFKKPIVVHCSDGVGRSGIFVAMEYILQKLQQGENCSNLIEVVKEIRNQRTMAIEKPSQYIVLNRLLLQFFHELHLVDMSQRLLEFIDDYDAYTRKHKE